MHFSGQFWEIGFDADVRNWKPQNKELFVERGFLPWFGFTQYYKAFPSRIRNISIFLVLPYAQLRDRSPIGGLPNVRATNY